MTDAAARAVAVARAQELLAQAVAALRAGSAREETLAEFVPERRVVGIPRAARMTPIGRVWRLGVLLLGADVDGGGVDGGGGLSVYATGRVVRAERPARRSIPANAVAEQRAYRAAAVKGGVAEGETVNFEASPIDLDELARAGASGPLVVQRDEVFVRWSPAQPRARR